MFNMGQNNNTLLFNVLKKKEDIQQGHFKLISKLIYNAIKVSTKKILVNINEPSCSKTYVQNKMYYKLIL